MDRMGDGPDSDRRPVEETDEDGAVLDPMTDTRRIEIVLDHLVNLTGQVRRLADLLRRAGIAVPADVGTLGPASDEVTERLMAESVTAHFPGLPMPWDDLTGGGRDRPWA